MTDRTLSFDEWLQERHGFICHMPDNLLAQTAMERFQIIVSEVPIYLDYVTTLAGVKRTPIIPDLESGLTK